MKHYIRTLGLIFSVALNVAFVGSYAYRTLTKQTTFAYEEMRLNAVQRAGMASSRDRFIRTIDQIGNNIIGLHMELIDAIASEPADRSTIDAKFEQIRFQQPIHAACRLRTPDGGQEYSRSRSKERVLRRAETAYSIPEHARPPLASA